MRRSPQGDFVGWIMALIVAAILILTFLLIILPALLRASH